MAERKMVPMPGTEKLNDYAKRQSLIRELEQLHREQRGWQRLVNDEELDYEVIEKIPTDELEKIVEEIRKEGQAMRCKAKIIEESGSSHYFDREGNELHEGDTIVYDNGTEKKLYLTESGTLGTDATNPVWIESGRAAPCEFGIYPLGYSDLETATLKKGE